MSHEAVFFSRDIYYAGALNGLQLLAERLNVDSAMILNSSSEDDYERYRLEKNAITFSEIQGDFSLAITFDLFDCNQEKLEQCFLSLSKNNMAFAIPDDEDERPWMYILFNLGTRRIVEIDEDDVMDEVKLLQPKKKQAES